MKLKTEIFKIDHNHVPLKNGRFLISEPFLSEVYFQRSVILLIEHNTAGSMGIVLNKQSGLMLNGIVGDLDDVAEIPVYLGGPVSTDRLFYLHTLGYLIPNSIRIAEGLYIDGDFDAVLSYIRSGNPVDGNLRFFLGYSGWEEGQLKKEIHENTWVVSSKLRIEQALKGEGDLSWRDAVASLGSKYRVWLNYPKNPYLN